tara:strand:- start:2493 stop:3023 length:531 start_codon:yes stop_codon:yes gene_type:complete
MNYISLIAIILGMIAVIITLKYIQYYDSFEKKLNKLNKNCLGNKIPNSLIDIQNSLELTDDQFNVLLEKNKKNIIGVLTKSNTLPREPRKEPSIIPKKQITLPTITLPKKPKKISPLNKIETFANYGYTSAHQRGLQNIKFTKFIKSNKPKKCKYKTYNNTIENIYKHSPLLNNGF